MKFIVTDNASNIASAVKNLGYKNFHCIGHILNLIVASTFKGIKSKEDIIDDDLNEYDFEVGLFQDDDNDGPEDVKTLNKNFKDFIKSNSSVIKQFNQSNYYKYIFNYILKNKM